MKEALILCDGVEVPRDVIPERFATIRRLAHRGPGAVVNLRIASSSHALLSPVSGRAADLMRIAAYAYAADQVVSRGGDADMYGDGWERLFTICLPVCDPDFWSTRPVEGALRQSLGFASGDRWAFRFLPARPDDGQVPFDLDPAQPLGDPDRVVLFSGGMDSLCATVDLISDDHRPLLVRHVPSNGIAGRQDRVIQALREQFEPTWHFPSVMFRTHRAERRDAAENTQRARPFLYATLGVVVANQLRLEEVVLADNGIVSLNLPINRQLIGSTATRSTHPKTLRLFNDLAQLVFERPVTIINPLAGKSRAETLDILLAAGVERLLQHSRSCGNHRALPAGQPHCGTCSQCIDRYIATRAVGLERYDPAEGYVVDIFRDALPPGKPRTMVLSYAGFAQRLDPMTDGEILREFPELYDAVDPAGTRTDEAVAEACELLRRHAAAVLGAINGQISRAPAGLTGPQLSDANLLRLMTAPALPIARWSLARSSAAREVTTLSSGSAQPKYLFRRAGPSWTVAWEGASGSFPSAKGLDYLHLLLSRPHEEIWAFDMEQAPTGHGEGAVEYGRMSTAQRSEAGVQVSRGQPGVEVHSPADRQELKRLLREASVEREEALRLGNQIELTRLDQQIAAIEREYSYGTDGRGKPRLLGSEQEKARGRVSRAVRRAMKEFDKHLPGLGVHLQRSVRTGNVCVYRPESSIDWSL